MVHTTDDNQKPLPSTNSSLSNKRKRSLETDSKDNLKSSPLPKKVEYDSSFLESASGQELPTSFGNSHSSSVSHVSNSVSIPSRSSPRALNSNNLTNTNSIIDDNNSNININNKNTLIQVRNSHSHNYNHNSTSHPLNLQNEKNSTCSEPEKPSNEQLPLSTSNSISNLQSTPKKLLEPVENSKQASKLQKNNQNEPREDQLLEIQQKTKIQNQIQNQTQNQTQLQPQTCSQVNGLKPIQSDCSMASTSTLDGTSNTPKVFGSSINFKKTSIFGSEFSVSLKSSSQLLAPTQPQNLFAQLGAGAGVGAGAGASTLASKAASAAGQEDNQQPANVTANASNTSNASSFNASCFNVNMINNSSKVINSNSNVGYNNNNNNNNPITGNKSTGGLATSAPTISGFGAAASLFGNNNSSSGFGWLKKKSDIEKPAPWKSQMGTSACKTKSATSASSAASFANENKNNLNTGSSSSNPFTTLNDKNESFKNGNSLHTRLGGEGGAGDSSNRLKEEPVSFDQQEISHQMGTVAHEPTLPQINVNTGEESERNILQINCKLYEYISSCRTWAERGTGLMRLNDNKIPGEHYDDHYKIYYPDPSALIDRKPRIIMRGQATHRLILNTKIWPDMMCTVANERSLKISGFHFETGKVSVYLIRMKSKQDCSDLCQAITTRLQILKSQSLSRRKDNQDRQDTQNEAENHPHQSSLATDDSNSEANTTCSTNNDCSQLEVDLDKTGGTETGTESQPESLSLSQSSASVNEVLSSAAEADADSSTLSFREEDLENRDKHKEKRENLGSIELGQDGDRETITPKKHNSLKRRRKNYDHPDRNLLRADTSEEINSQCEAITEHCSIDGDISRVESILEVDEEQGIGGQNDEDV